MKIIAVQDLYIYPIKSLGGIRLSQAIVEEKGFQYDRRWMLVDSRGHFLTQRTHQQMTFLKVDLSEEGLTVFDSKSANDSLFIPHNQISNQKIEVVIWDDRVIANLVDETADVWFSKKLEIACHLVIMPDFAQRKLSLKDAVNEQSVSFADGMPYLILGQESLQELNSRLVNKVKMDRFRPNIVFAGGESFVEDTWKKIKIGSISFQVVKPCARCIMTTIDQQTGEQGKEPLKTLSSYRTHDNKIYFGQNMVALQKGILRVGDLVQIE